MDDKEHVGIELRDNVIRLFPGRAWEKVGSLDVALAVLDRLDRLSAQIDRLAELMSPPLLVGGGALTPDPAAVPPPSPPRPLRPILVPGHPFPEDR